MRTRICVHSHASSVVIVATVAAAVADIVEIKIWVVDENAAGGTCGRAIVAAIAAAAVQLEMSESSVKSRRHIGALRCARWSRHGGGGSGGVGAVAATRHKSINRRPTEEDTIFDVCAMFVHKNGLCCFSTQKMSVLFFSTQAMSALFFVHKKKLTLVEYNHQWMSVDWPIV